MWDFRGSTRGGLVVTFALVILSMGAVFFGQTPAAQFEFVVIDHVERMPSEN